MLCYCWQFEVYCLIPQLCNLQHSYYCILGVSLRDVGKRLILPRMIIPLLQPCCRHMFVSGIGWRLNIFFSKKGWKFCVALRMVFMLVSLFKTPIDCYLWKKEELSCDYCMALIFYITLIRICFTITLYQNYSRFTIIIILISYGMKFL